MLKTNRPFQLIAATALSLGLLILMVGTVSAHPAHAKVLSSTPAIGSTITTPPTSVSVVCAENINPNPKLSNLFVYAPTGELISQGNATVSLSSPTNMSVNIKPSGNGIYVVRWITVSALDGDPDQGAYVFTVKPAVTATPTATTANTTTNTASNSGSGGTPLWADIVIGAVALLVGLGAGWGIGRARTSSPSIGTMRQNIAAQQQEPTSTKK